MPVFEMHSGFWMNLHHVLYRQARQRAGRAQGEPEPVRLDGINLLSAEEAAAWNSAINFYQREYAGRDLLFNSDMVILKNRLAEWEAEETLQTSGLRPEVIRTLDGAATVYRSRWWTEHDRRNRDWIARVAPLVQKHGAELARQLALAYRQPWPAERIRVEVSVEANWAGAYTTLRPLHVVLSSSDPRNQGPAGFEMLFHEASHALAESVSEAIARECRARRKPIPRDLWHAILFFTTGEMVRRAMAAVPPQGDGETPYTPYAYRHGLYARGWQSYQSLIERHWKPYLDGQLDFDRAIARIVSAI